MKIHIISDLHLEFAKFHPHSASNEADVIVLPGDIGKGIQGVNWAREQWPDKEIIYVCGNHEFYGLEINGTHAQIKQAGIDKNVHVLDNDEIIIDGVRFLGCPIWTDFKLFGDALQKECMLQGEKGLNDFRLIAMGERKFRVQDSIDLHNESVKWLEMKLKRESFDGATVVVTHHLPSTNSVVARYKLDLLSACFASNLDHLLGFSELWIHGHTHDSLDYVQEGTRVVCNPRGYTRYDKECENSEFNPRLIIELTKSVKI